MSTAMQADVIAVGGNTEGCYIYGGEIVPAFTAASRSSNTPFNTLVAAYSRVINKFIVSTSSATYTSSVGLSYTSLCSYGGKDSFLIDDISNGSLKAYYVMGNRLLIYEGSAYSVTVLPVGLSCGCMHCNRLFGADKNDKLMLRWSCEGVEDWTEGINGSGYLKLTSERGNILDLIEYGGKLVAVREYGLTVFNMHGNVENFAVEITDTDCERIFAHTAAVVCGKLLFCSEAGVKAFDGHTITAPQFSCSQGISSPVRARSYGNAYYLSCSKKSTGAHVLICYKPQSGASYYIPCDAYDMCVKDKLYVFCSSGLYTLEEGKNYKFESYTFNFGTAARKTLTAIEINGCADVEVSNGVKSRFFRSASGKIRPRIQGRQFSVKVAGKQKISGLVAFAEVNNAL